VTQYSISKRSSHALFAWGHFRIDGVIGWNALSGTSPLNNYVIYGGHDKQNRSQGSILGSTYLGSAQLDFSEIKKQLYSNKISDNFFSTKGSSFFTTCQVKNKSTSKYS